MAFGIDTEENGEQKIKQLAWRLGNAKHKIPNGFEANSEQWYEGYISAWEHFGFEKHQIPLDYDQDLYFSISLDEITNKETFYINGKKVISRSLGTRCMVNI